MLYEVITGLRLVEPLKAHEDDSQNLSRLEKFATDETGPILVCRMTRQLVAKGARFAEDDPLGFRDLGPMHAKGFDYPDHVFSLLTPDS